MPTPRASGYVGNVTAQAVGRVSSAASTLVVAALVARYLGVTEYGRFTYVLIFAGLAVCVAEFGTTAILARDLASAEGRTPEYWGHFILLRLALSVLAGLAAAPVAFALDRALYPYVWATLLALPFLASRFFEPLYQAYHRPWFSALSSAGYAAALLIGLGIVLALGGTLSRVLAVYLAANVAYTILAFVLAGRLVRPRFTLDRGAMARLLASAAPLGVSAVVATLNSRADVFILARLRGGDEVGLYNAAYRFLDAATMAATILMAPAIQVFARQAVADRDGLRGTFARVLESIGLAAIPVAILAPYVSTALVTAVFGPAFAPSAAPLNVLAGAGVLVFVSLFSYGLCVALGVVRFAYWLTGLAAALNIALNLRLVPVYGYMASAWATVASELVMAGVALAVIHLRLGNIVRAGAWLRIAGLCGGLWLLCRAGVPALGWPALPLAAAYYLGGAVVLRLMPIPRPSMPKPTREVP